MNEIEKRRDSGGARVIKREKKKRRRRGLKRYEEDGNEGGGHEDRRRERKRRKLGILSTTKGLGRTKRTVRGMIQKTVEVGYKVQYRIYTPEERGSSGTKSRTTGGNSGNKPKTRAIRERTMVETSRRENLESVDRECVKTGRRKFAKMDGRFSANV